MAGSVTCRREASGGGGSAGGIAAGVLLSLGVACAAFVVLRRRQQQGRRAREAGQEMVSPPATGVLESGDSTLEAWDREEDKSVFL